MTVLLEIGISTGFAKVLRFARKLQQSKRKFTAVTILNISAQLLLEKFLSRFEISRFRPDFWCILVQKLYRQVLWGSEFRGFWGGDSPCCFWSHRSPSSEMLLPSFFLQMKSLFAEFFVVVILGLGCLKFLDQNGCEDQDSIDHYTCSGPEEKDQ